MYWIYIELFYVYIYFHQFLYGRMLVQRYWFHIDTLTQVVVYLKYNNMWGEKETMKKGEHNHVDKPKRAKHGMMNNRRCK